MGTTLAGTLPRMDARLRAGARLWSARLRWALALSAVLFVTGLFTTGAQAAFDHSHAKFDALLKQHVTWISDGGASQVDYAAIKRDPSLLKGYLDEIAAVSNEEYGDFTKPQQLAFLINVYNAYTIDFVLTEYPNIDSIKELGSLFSSPWKKKLFPLFGEKRSLDEIEHGMIRKPGDFDDPRMAARPCATKRSLPSGSTRSSRTACADFSATAAAIARTKRDFGCRKYSIGTRSTSRNSPVRSPSGSLPMPKS